MPKRATKAASNVFYQARINAASYNDKLWSREGASEVTGIDRNRIVYTELGTTTPYPEEVLVYSDTYNAPELCHHFCSNLCPIGRETMDSVNVVGLEQASLKLLASTRHISQMREEFLDIVEDGVIEESEIPQMKKILNYLRKASNDIKALELICKKMMKGGVGTDVKLQKGCTAENTYR